MPTVASLLVRGVAPIFLAAPRGESGFLKREWQEIYLSALARDFSIQIPHPGAATVVLGTASLPHTTALASQSEALVFVDLHQIAIVTTLSERLRRVVELVYGSDSKQHHDSALPLLPHQKHFQAMGLVALAALGGALDACEGRTTGLPPGPVRAMGFLADRAAEGIRSLALLRGVWESGHQSGKDEQFPSWNPTTPAFIVAHEFGHLYMGGNIHHGAFESSFRDNPYMLSIAAECLQQRVHWAQRVIEDLQRYDDSAAQQCRSGVDDMKDDPALHFETFADVIAMVAATSLLTRDDEIALDLDNPPSYPPADLLMWHSTAAGVALVQAAREMGRQITTTNIGSTSEASFSRALGAYLLRAWASVVAAVLMKQRESSYEARVIAGHRLILAGLQCMTELRAGVEDALGGEPLVERPPPRGDFARGAELFGVRLGDRKITTRQRLAEDSDPACALTKMRTSHDECVSLLFRVGFEPFEADYRDHPELPFNTPEQRKKNLWE